MLTHRADLHIGEKLMHFWGEAVALRDFADDRGQRLRDPIFVAALAKFRRQVGGACRQGDDIGRAVP